MRQSEGWFSVVQRTTKRMVIYRWLEAGRERKRTLGTVRQFPDERSRWKEVGRLGIQPAHESSATFLQVATHWINKEGSLDETDPAQRRAYSTRCAIRVYINGWLIPKWGTYSLEDFKPPEVEDWLLSLDLAPGTKKKLRDIMHLLFQHAGRHGWWSKPNPIQFVRQSGKRLETPERLGVEELSRLIYQVLGSRERVMVLLGFGTGVRRSELEGLRWEDLDFEQKVLTLKRSIVNQRVGDLKTEASRKPVPLDDDLIAELHGWRAQTPYAADSDYVFASPKMRGVQPYWLDGVMRKHIKPAASKAGIRLKGWHTLRHSYTTLLRQHNDDRKVVQDLLRHANYRVTAEIYDSAVLSEKRTANSKVVRLVTRERTAERTAQSDQVAVTA
jgi:integrase